MNTMEAMKNDKKVRFPRINKMIDDTLKGPNGKWSRKSLTAFVSFINAILVGWFIVVSQIFLPEGSQINQYAIMVFLSFLGSGVGTLGLTVIDKMKKYGGHSDE